MLWDWLHDEFQVFYRLRKRRNWNNWGEKWFLMLDLFPTLRILSFHRSECNFQSKFIHNIKCRFNERRSYFFLLCRSSKVATKPMSPKLRVVHRGRAATVSKMRWKVESKLSVNCIWAAGVARLSWTPPPISFGNKLCS